MTRLLSLQLRVAFFDVTDCGASSLMQFLQSEMVNPGMCLAISQLGRQTASGCAK